MMEISVIGKVTYLTDGDRLDRYELKRRFTNRQPLIGDFEKKLKQSPPVPVLVFFGLGGCGKTYLLHFLRQEYSYCWRDTPQGDPHAYISFRPGHTATSTPEALWSLRSQLREFTFPRFDLLWGRLWERTYKLPIRDNVTLIPEEIAWLTGLLESTEKVPLLGEVSKAINLLARLGGRAKRWLTQRNVLDWFVEHLEKPYNTNWKIALQMLEMGELQMLLPKAIAADLADSTAQLKLPHNRAILFVDTYEHLQEQLGELRGKEPSTFVQVLAEELVRLRASVLLVIAGKDKMRWAEVRRHDGTWVLNNSSLWAEGVTRNDASGFISAFLKQYPVGDFSKQDSMEYLEQRRGITDQTMVREIYKLTGGYPLGLSTAVDLMEEAGEQASAELAILRARTSGFKPLSKEWREELSGWLLERLLEQLTQHGHNALVGLLRAAAIPRWFNEDLLFYLVGAFDLQDQFNRLVCYSFVEPHEIAMSTVGIRSYRLHSTMRRLVLQDIRIETQSRRWNNAARIYFENLMGNLPDSEQRFAYEVEALYHKAVFNLTEGLHAFEKAFERELSRYRLTRCEAILQALREVDSWKDAEEARILTLAGRLYMVSVQYELALEMLSEAERLQPLSLEFAPHRVAIAQNLAECHRLKGEYSEALRRWEEIRRVGEQYKEPHAQFLAAWGVSLTYKLLDNLPRAFELCNEADGLLETIRDNIKSIASAAFGVHDLTTKSADLNRHKAELLRYMGDYASAATCCERFLSLYQPDSLGYYYGLLIMSHLSRMEGNFEHAQSLAQQAKYSFEKLIEPRGQLSATRALGQIAFSCEDDTGASEHFQRLLASPSSVYPYGPIYGHLGMGELARLSGDLAGAKQHYETAAWRCRGLGGKVEAAYAQLGLAEIARHNGEHNLALSLVAEVNDIGIACGHPWIQVYANLVGASAASKEQQPSFLDKAVRAGGRFRRGQSDKNVERQAITKVQELLTIGRQVPPFRFNFL